MTAILLATCTFGWSTPAQQAALVALRRWESALGRAATWEQDLESVGGGDAAEKSEFTIAIHRASTVAMAEVFKKLLGSGWTSADAASLPLHLVPPLDDLEPGPLGRLDVCSFWLRSGWVSDKFEGSAEDVATMLASIAGVQVAKVQLARVGWTKARAEGPA